MAVVTYHVPAFRDPVTEEEKAFANPFIQVELLVSVEDGYIVGSVEELPRSLDPQKVS